MTAPAAPTTTTTSTSGEFHGPTENINSNGYSAPNGHPAGAAYPAPNGYQGYDYQGYGYPGAPMAPAPAPVVPITPAAAPRSRTGLPWFIAGATLWAIALTHLMLLPQWLETKTTDGVIGNLTGVLAEIGIGAALLAVGFARRKEKR